ncbi:ABC transporter substrate-binding protein [Aphanothece sacrum]|uniref:Branched-chain amino acid ABC transporter substrate-binding protein n=1 Tax=Aphanothece sacrum FPU1 TaxID=1920663 RepID=A0A401ICI0_APHSA|nr:ABC transporter substrate-binding protein [Aphanothece sacrum]GBF79003.1 branched-chain amino acid ABC transporter substrate-binding protein [Aphanothece sacrum FPU1]GBF84452.1 hydrophobic amino acid uptake ABC-transporter [Aphanothece sacrum FPU3]
MNNYFKIISGVLSGIGVVTVIIVLWEIALKPIIIPSSTIIPSPSPSPEIPLEQRFSSGDRRLFVNKTNPKAEQGITAFKSQNYDQAKELFTEAVNADRNDPEVQIYLNNTEAIIKGTPFILATVIPADTKVNNAETMLRGIADAQTKFNQKGLNNRLLEIIIVNDSNDATIAQKVAQKLSNNSSVLGVIGHNSSSATKSALTEYEKVKLSVISPTSTATNLFGNVFFRTVPSNIKIGNFLAKYALKNNLNRVAVFYTSKDSLKTDKQNDYSISLKDAFVKEFQGLGEVTTFDMSASDFNIQETVKSLENQVDAIVLFPNTDKEIITMSLQVAQANDNLSTPLKLLGGDTLYNADPLTFDGKAVEGLVLAVPWFAKENYLYAKIADKRWGGQVSWRTATSYDATQAFIKALSQDATRQTILNNLKQTNLSKEETSGESLRFFSNGDRDTDPVLVKVIKGGKNRPQGSDYSFDIIK